MNTTKAGDIFEQRVYSLFSEELSQGRLFLPFENCKMFHKKGYYSKDRQKDIIVDISIEVILPGQDKYSLLVIIECKNYNHPVPVDDVEEFYAKIQQISGANIKGIIVSSNSFQQSAFNYSQSKGIGFVRLLDQTNFKWILTRSATGLVTWEEYEKNKSTIYHGLSTENYTSEYIEFFSYFDSKVTNSAGQFIELLTENSIPSMDEMSFEQIINHPKEPETFVPYIPSEKIEGLCCDIVRDLKNTEPAVPIEELCEKLVSSGKFTIKYQDSLGFDGLGFEILGRISYNPTIIQISNSVENIYRRKFTLAHELGHYFLNHFQFIVSEYYSDADFENSVPQQLNIKDIKRLEWQANYFASCLLLPSSGFLKEFNELANKYELKNRGYGRLYVDNQQCNLDNYFKITNKLKDSFKVSRKAIEIRLKELNLLNDKR